MLETRVEHLHKAFQTLIDWSIDEVAQDICAVISGPIDFSSNHRGVCTRTLAKHSNCVNDRVWLILVYRPFRGADFFIK
jgi:hypothetical protein